MWQSLRSHLPLTLTLVTLLLFAFLLRIYHLESIPIGLYPDEAANGVDALHALETHHFELFYPANYGREGLFINLQALSIWLLGNTMIALKLCSVLFGTFTVLGLFLLGRELFHRTGAGLAAAFMIATSYWAINFSRIGFRAIMTAFLLSFTFYFFFRGLRTQKKLDFLWAGLIFGLGLHTYIAFRVAPLILILLLPALMLSYEHFLQRFWKHGLTFILGAFIAAAPMMYHFFITHPEDFESRSTHISIFSPQVNHGDLPGTLVKTFSTSLIKYTFFGDQNWRHNYPPYPLLDPIVGTFFLTGFFLLFFRFFRLLYRRLRYHDRDFRLIVDTFLFGSFFTMLAPEFLTNEGLPHALRSIGTQVPVFLFATVPVLWILKKAKHGAVGLRIVILSFLLIVFSISATWNITKYFILFAENPKAGESFNENYTNMARYLLSLPDDTHKYYLIDGGGNRDRFHLPVASMPVYFFTYGKVKNFEIVTPDTLVHRPGVYIMTHFDQAKVEELKALFPESYTKHIDMNGPGRDGGDFTAVILPETN
ncbi:MAG: glycosyltransferase family 39 protein [Candidatus Moranbacteria bacterium]|nr:glycosyltransferase family 39 protein [Candidatus Moranbacteria bacterium]